MSDLVGNPEDRFSSEAAETESANLFFWSAASRTSALTQTEKNVGLSITSKLDSLINPGGSAAGFSDVAGQSRAGFRAPTYLDMMLVLDSSGSIGNSEFREAKEATTVV